MLRNMKLKKKKTIPRPTIFKLPKISDEEKILKAPEARGKGAVLQGNKDKDKSENLVKNNESERWVEPYL